MSEPQLYFFDMDHTLINNDCDVSWKEFLVEKGLAPKDALETADYFFEEYIQGRLDFDEFLEFQLAEFKGKSYEDMAELARVHFKEKVEHVIYNDARVLVKEALDSGKVVSLLTATNRIIAEPLAEALGIPEICSTELEMKDSVFTGEIMPPYCGSEGKIVHAKRLCEKHGVELTQVKYYGDSISDQYILAEVGFAVAVNPGEALRTIANDKNWEIMDVK